MLSESLEDAPSSLLQLSDRQLEDLLLLYLPAVPGSPSIRGLAGSCKRLNALVKPIQCNWSAAWAL
jgi:hypothetical protein